MIAWMVPGILANVTSFSTDKPALRTSHYHLLGSLMLDMNLRNCCFGRWSRCGFKRPSSPSSTHCGPFGLSVVSGAFPNRPSINTAGRALSNEIKAHRCQVSILVKNRIFASIEQCFCLCKTRFAICYNSQNRPTKCYTSRAIVQTRFVIW